MNKLRIAEHKYPLLWSSTEYSATGVWSQFFFDGAQLNCNKSNSYWARAIRRKPKS